MLTLKQAQQIVLNNVKISDPIEVDIRKSEGFCLAEDICSNANIPSFDNSAMDGYAVVSTDLKNASQKNQIKLKIIEEIPAGHFPKEIVQNGEASLIMTGAPTPQGADSVVMIEYTKRMGDYVEVFKSVKKGENIRRKGEVIKKEQLLLKKNAFIRPQEIALLATMNKKNAFVYRKPKIAIFSTGDEIASLGKSLKTGQIVDSNRYALMSKIKKMGCKVIDLGIVRDNKLKIENAFKKALKNADVIITIGGVSVGSWDFVKDIVKKLGNIIFWKINMKPGGPTTFGKIKDKLFFGLPGNPVSSLIAFDQIVEPALLKMQGNSICFKQKFYAVLGNDYFGKKGKLRIERVHIASKNEIFWANPVRSLGSADLKSMTDANGVIFIPKNIPRLKKGGKVLAQFL